MKTLITVFGTRPNSDTNTIIIADCFPIVNPFVKKGAFELLNQRFLGSLFATLALLIIITQAMKNPTMPPTMTPPANINHPIALLLSLGYKKRTPPKQRPQNNESFYLFCISAINLYRIRYKDCSTFTTISIDICGKVSAT